MSTSLSKTYDPQEIEDTIYKLWIKSGFFNPDNLKETKENFVVSVAPPNITGELHMGHALENTLMDIVVRMKRMQGYKTLWIPGTDHAGIATQNAVEKQLKKEGVSRREIGREKFVKRAWKWKEKYGNIILGQLKKLGCSLDWSRERFTMDEQYQEGVRQAFIHYFEKGWIYRGIRVVNWCVGCGTSISDLEVKYEPERAVLYYIKFGPLTVATVRPETRLGDTGLAVHPDDERYKKYIGKELKIESVDNSIPRDKEPKKKEIKIPVVADNSVDPKFGSGIIKVTPAHDISDSEIAQRHKLLFLKVIDEKGYMTKEAGIRYEGLTTSEARKLIVKDMEKLGLIIKEEEYEHNIARCDRCNSTIEPLPSKQWFLKMDKLADHAKKLTKEKKVVFSPKRWEGPYLTWLEKVRDWNISRQLWWGHRLPVWFHEPKCVPRPGHEEDMKKCEDMKVSIEKPDCKYCDAKYIQSEDVLDTWFSSALWPFAILGWPQKTKDLKNYYPNHIITSARDILHLWITRMIFTGIEFTGDSPFKDVLIHPTILTKEGKRMSKSLGTGIDPLSLMGEYGSDAVRFGLTYQTTGIQDMRFNKDVIAMGKKFANKIWNATRFALLQLENKKYKLEIPSKLNEAEKKIMNKFNEISKNTTSDIESYRFGQAASGIYHFFWNDFCDRYIEYTKKANTDESRQVLIYVLAQSLKLLHPFMPFITEELYAKLPLKDKKMLIIEKWPT